MSTITDAERAAQQPTPGDPYDECAVCGRFRYTHHEFVVDRGVECAVCGRFRYEHHAFAARRRSTPTDAERAYRHAAALRELATRARRGDTDAARVLIDAALEEGWISPDDWDEDSEWEAAIHAIIQRVLR